MALSGVVKTDSDGSLTLLDGTGTPLTLTVRFSQGNFNLGGFTNSLREAVTIVARNRTIGLRKGAPTYPSVSFSCFISDLGEATAGTIVNWEAKTAPYASRVKTHSIGDLDTYDIKLTIEGTDHGDAADQSIRLHDVHGTWTFAEDAGGNNCSFSGTVYGNVAMTDAGAQATTFTAPR